MIRNVVLAIILVFQLGVWFAFDSPLSQEKPKSKEIVNFKLEDTAIEEAIRVEITAPGAGTLSLTRVDTTWCIDNLQGYPAIQDKVLKALAELRPLGSAEFRTNKAFLHENLGVDEKKATKIKLMAQGGRVVADLLVGQRDVQNSGGTFIRRGNDDVVFVAKSKLLASIFSVVPRNWRTPGLWDFDSNDRQRATDLKQAAYRIEVEGIEPLPRRAPEGTERKRFRHVVEAVPADKEAKVPAHWRVIEPESKKDLFLADLAVRSLVSQVLNMRSNDVVGRGIRPEYGLSNVDEMEARVTVYFKEGDFEVTRTAEIGAARPATSATTGQPTYYVRTSHPGEKISQAFVHSLTYSFVSAVKRPVEAYIDKSRAAQKQPDDKNK